MSRWARITTFQTLSPGRTLILGDISTETFSWKKAFCNLHIYVCSRNSNRKCEDPVRDFRIDN